MKRNIEITATPIDVQSLTAQRIPSAEMGAVVTFAGVVRRIEDAEPIAGLEYEAYLSMAKHQFNLVLAHVEERWPVDSIRVVHRVGFVPTGEPSLWVEVVALHRGEAFAACQFLIDEMKRTVPIWKKPIPLQQ